jgi:hypothetical protein
MYASALDRSSFAGARAPRLDRNAEGAHPSLEPTVLKYPALNPPSNAPWNRRRPSASVGTWRCAGSALVVASEDALGFFLSVRPRRLLALEGGADDHVVLGVGVHRAPPRRRRREGKSDPRTPARAQAALLARVETDLKTSTAASSFSLEAHQSSARQKVEFFWEAPKSHRKATTRVPFAEVAREGVAEARARGRRATQAMGRKRCRHGKRKDKCADCNPCPHGRVKYGCADCNPCPHGKLKGHCADCKGCPHGKLKSDCADCNPCPHGKRKSNCTVCSGCEHGKRKENCTVCSGCEHGKRKYSCKACKSARAEQPVAPEVKPEPEIKPEPEVKLEPEIKQEPFTIRGYFGIGD